MLSADTNPKPPPRKAKRTPQKRPTSPTAKPLTRLQRRCERAWRKVQTQPKGSRRYAFTMGEIADATGISLRTVADMRTVDSILRARGVRNLGTWADARKRAYGGREVL